MRYLSPRATVEASRRVVETERSVPDHAIGGREAVVSNRGSASPRTLHERRLEAKSACHLIVRRVSPSGLVRTGNNLTTLAVFSTEREIARVASATV